MVSNIQEFSYLKNEIGSQVLMKKNWVSFEERNGVCTKKNTNYKRKSMGFFFFKYYIL